VFRVPFSVACTIRDECYQKERGQWLKNKTHKAIIEDDIVEEKIKKARIETLRLEKEFDEHRDRKMLQYFSEVKDDYEKWLKTQQ
jgi:hypothetical protein